MLIGVEDRTRHVRGVKEPLDLEERLANLISDHIVPRLVPELEIVPWRRSHVLAIQVYASPVRPHYIRREGLDRGVYVRVGSTNRRADRELIDELRRFARGEAYDEQPMPGLDSEALDFRAASESFAPVRRLRRTDLHTLRLVTTHQGRNVPTVGGTRAWFDWWSVGWFVRSAPALRTPSDGIFSRADNRALGDAMRHDDQDEERRRCGLCGKVLQPYDSISVAEVGERCSRCFNKELAERLGVDFDNTPIAPA